MNIKYSWIARFLRTMVKLIIIIAAFYSEKKQSIHIITQFNEFMEDKAILSLEIAFEKMGQSLKIS